MDDLTFFVVTAVILQIQPAVSGGLWRCVIVMLIKIDVITVSISLLKVKLRGLSLIIQMHAVLTAASVIIDRERFERTRRTDANLEPMKLPLVQ